MSCYVNTLLSSSLHVISHTILNNPSWVVGWCIMQPLWCIMQQGKMALTC